MNSHDTCEIQQASTDLTFNDRTGGWLARWGIGRMNYTVEPGLYAIGTPDDESPVFASANYRMSFNILRKSLKGIDCYILVLDTHGINVWCAAGKGTFGTFELATRILTSDLEHIVKHRKIIVPQLGAPGVSARDVKRMTDFTVIYGPVRAEDIPVFLENGMTATPEMRMVTFTIRERAVLIPMELIPAMKYTVPAAMVLLLLSGVHKTGLTPERIADSGVINMAFMIGATIAGAAGVPLLLPWLPGTMFFLKGIGVGVILDLMVFMARHSHFPYLPESWQLAAWMFLIPALTGYLAMNFTGATPYTSQSGVQREMKIALPLLGITGAVGVALWFTSLLL